jgi:hypothetical protein
MKTCCGRGFGGMLGGMWKTLKALVPQLATLGLMMGMTSCPKIGDVLRQFGYTELKPPSQLMKPGTMVFVENTNPFQTGIICTQPMSLGKDFKPIETPTSNETLSRANQVKFDVGADYLKMVTAKAEFSAVKSITVELKNPKIYTVSDVDVINAIKDRDPVCSQAISSRLRAGFPVTMIARALMADSTYHVSFKEDVALNASVRLAMLAGLAPQLGISQGTNDDSSISGKDLFWGVMDDTYLSRLSMNGTAAGPSGSSPGDLPERDQDAPERLIPVEAQPIIKDSIDTALIDADDDDDLPEPAAAVSLIR